MQRPGVANVKVTWRWDPRIASVVFTFAQNAEASPYQVGLSFDATDSRGRVHRSRVMIPAARVATVNVKLRLEGATSKIVFDPDVSFLGNLTTQ